MHLQSAWSPRVDGRHFGNKAAPRHQHEPAQDPMRAHPPKRKLSDHTTSRRTHQSQLGVKERQRPQAYNSVGSDMEVHRPQLQGKGDMWWGAGGPARGAIWHRCGCQVRGRCSHSSDHPGGHSDASLAVLTHNLGRWCLHRGMPRPRRFRRHEEQCGCEGQPQGRHKPLHDCPQASDP